MISDEQLAEWERLASEATAGPWKASQFGGVVRSGHELRDVATRCNREEDAVFIAAAREAVPALIARVRELEASEKEATRIITDLNVCCDIKDRQIERLAREADWLAKRLEQEGVEVMGLLQTADTWREAARKAVQND